MSGSKHPYQAYSAAMQTMAGTRQIVVLYEGVLRHLQLAREAMVEGRIEDRYTALTRASEIVFGLQGCLDFEKGGNIASVLYNFYSTIDIRIFALHRTGSVEECDAIIADIRQMRDVWDEIDRSNPNAEQSDSASDGQDGAGAPPSPQGPSGVALSA